MEQTNNHEERYEDNNELNHEVILKDCKQAGLITLMRCALPSRVLRSVAASPVVYQLNILIKTAACQLDDTGVSIISTIPTVIYLTLDKNLIGARGAEYISRMGNLTWLNLVNNDIRNEGATHLCKLTKLTWVNLETNNITDLGKAKLKKHFPKINLFV